MVDFIDSSNNIMRGVVKWFNDEKGFGFITNSLKEDIFIHYSAIEGEGYKSLNESDEVEFELIITDKGFQAKNIKLLKHAVQ